MMREIERKFQVISDSWFPFVTSSVAIEQFYLSVTDSHHARVRKYGDQYFAAVKIDDPVVEPWTSKVNAKVRYEYEFEISETEFIKWKERALFGLSKIRYLLSSPRKNEDWCIDVYQDGTTVAEVEFVTFDATDYELPYLFVEPGFLGKDCTNDPRFSNIEIAKRQSNEAV